MSQLRAPAPAPAAALGLTEAEALARRQRGLGNNVPLASSRSYEAILRENLLTFINVVLFTLGLGLILLGRVSEALVSVGVISVNLLVGVLQELRAKHALDRIALLTRPRATVLRDATERSLDPREVVVGDVLLLRPGDQVVADGSLVEGRLDADESLLTGESDPVPKRVGDRVSSGSFCVNGSGAYVAEQVGAASLAHQMATEARAYRRVSTPLQRQVNLVIRLILVVTALFEGTLVLYALVTGLPLLRVVQDSVVIAGLVPNGLFLAIAVAYVMGAVRMAGKGALVQRASAIESLSHVDVLCMDKTGTLTANRLALASLVAWRMPEAELRAWLGHFAASVSAPNRTAEAIRAACPGQRRAVRAEVPFSSARKWSALAFEDGVTYVLGAPEILGARLTDAAEILARADELAAGGQRVVLFAVGGPDEALHDGDGEACLPSALEALGLLALDDELRPEARETIAGFRAAGIRLKVISGDHPRTVAALAERVGIAAEERVTGAELDELDAVRLAEVAERATVFGRVTPRHKEALVAALRGRGHHVAMIGDGVNDVLSLKRADLGIAMQSGSQATRAAADIVLLGDSFAALPHAAKEGQRILNGMQGILQVYLTRVLYMALLIDGVAALSLGFPFLPKQSSLLVLLTVGIPTLALAAWARPGVVAKDGLVRSLLHFVVPAAFSLAVVALVAYAGFYALEHGRLLALAPELGQEIVRASSIAVAQNAVTTLAVFCGLLLILFVEPPARPWTGGNRLSGDLRPTLLVALLLAAYLAILVLEPARAFFELRPLAVAEYLALGLASLGWALALRQTWRLRLLERLLDVDLGPGSAGDP